MDSTDAMMGHIMGSFKKIKWFQTIINWYLAYSYQTAFIHLHWIAPTCLTKLQPTIWQWWCDPTTIMTMHMTVLSSILWNHLFSTPVMPLLEPQYYHNIWQYLLIFTPYMSKLHTLPSTMPYANTALPPIVATSLAYLPGAFSKLSPHCSRVGLHSNYAISIVSKTIMLLCCTCLVHWFSNNMRLGRWLATCLSTRRHFISSISMRRQSISSFPAWTQSVLLWSPVTRQSVSLSPMRRQSVSS